MRPLSPSLILLLAAACTPSGGAVDPTPKPEPNEAPGAPQVALSAASPATDADLTVVFLAQSADLDGDVVTYRYTWFQDGSVRADLTTDIVPASETVKGQVWRVVVTPNDGALDGPVGEASATVVNTAPVAQVSLPASATTTEDLVATTSATDLDDDAFTFAYAWARDGVAQDDLTAATVPAARTSHGELWTVTATPNDGEADGAPVSASLTIANTAPTVEGVSLTPVSPRADDTLLATVEGASDADADDVSFTYTWFVDDVAVQSGAADTLAGTYVAKHQLVRVEVVPDDGLDIGASVGSEDVVVENTAPRGTGASVSPSTLVEASTATCVPAGWTDADGDTESWTTSWLVNGVTVSSVSTLDGASFAKGDMVTCVATPFDGEASGTSLTSSSVRVANTAPTLASVALSTTAPTESDTVSVTVSGASDADGDSVSYQYAWRVNGTLVGTSSTLAPSRFAKGDRIDLTVTPFDGTDLGTPAAAVTAIAADSPPVVTSVSLTPSTPTTNSVLSASATTTDADGDRVSLSYTWSVNGIPTGTTGSTLNGATYFDRDDVVTVTVTPNDGEGDGAAVTSSSVTVRNTAPTTPGVAITPASARPGDDLVCEVTTPSTDVDGEGVSYAFTWTKNGRAYTSTTGTSWSGNTVAGVDVSDTDVFVCSATATDGAATSAASATSATYVYECNVNSAQTVDGVAFATVCANTFTMGCTAAQVATGMCVSDESPSTTVTMAHAYLVSAFEVTQGSYQSLMGSNPSGFSSCGTSCPVEQVSWHMAAAYTNALSTRAGLTTCYACTGSGSSTRCVETTNPYSCMGYRLPTEAEWENAARCDGDLVYAGSNVVGDVAWYGSNSGSITHAVGGRGRNACGLADMSGNVWEWVNDWYGPYSGVSEVDPVGAASGSSRIFRGGGWGDTVILERLSARGGRVPTHQAAGVGFRIARTLP